MEMVSLNTGNTLCLSWNYTVWVPLSRCALRGCYLSVVHRLGSVVEYVSLLTAAREHSTKGI